VRDVQVFLHEQGVALKGRADDANPLAQHGVMEGVSLPILADGIVVP
jgi:hypothetical protein